MTFSNENSLSVREIGIELTTTRKLLTFILPTPPRAELALNEKPWACKSSLLRSLDESFVSPSYSFQMTTSSLKLKYLLSTFSWRWPTTSACTSSHHGSATRFSAGGRNSWTLRPWCRWALLCHSTQARFYEPHYVLPLARFTLTSAIDDYGLSLNLAKPVAVDLWIGL